MKGKKPGSVTVRHCFGRWTQTPAQGKVQGESAALIDEVSESRVVQAGKGSQGGARAESLGRSSTMQDAWEGKAG
jgi:hypothetical protein